MFFFFTYSKASRHLTQRTRTGTRTRRRVRPRGSTAFTTTAAAITSTSTAITSSTSAIRASSNSGPGQLEPDVGDGAVGAERHDCAGARDGDEVSWRFQAVAVQGVAVCECFKSCFKHETLLLAGPAFSIVLLNFQWIITAFTVILNVEMVEAQLYPSVAGPRGKSGKHLQRHVCESSIEFLMYHLVRTLFDTRNASHRCILLGNLVSLWYHSLLWSTRRKLKIQLEFWLCYTAGNQARMLWTSIQLAGYIDWHNGKLKLTGRTFWFCASHCWFSYAIL